MLQHTLPEYNITLIDFNQIFIKKIQIDVLDDLYRYKLLNKSLSNTDVRKIFYHHIIFNICEQMLQVTCSKPIMIFNYTQLDDCIIKDYFKEDALLEFLDYTVSKIQKNLPVKIFKSKFNVETLMALKAKGDGRALTVLTGVIHNSNAFNVNSYTFENIKKITKKYELTFLNLDYFNRLKTKQLLF